MSFVKTRTSDVCPLFGNVQDIIPESAVQLLTYQDVIKCYHSVRLQLKGESSKQPSMNEVATIVAKKIIEVWNRASLPVLSQWRIIDMIKGYNGKYITVIKPFKNRKTPGYEAKLNKFKTNSLFLFDVCACKCPDIEICQCERSRKVSTLEWPFLQDQRNKRNMVMVVSTKFEVNKYRKECKGKKKK